MSEQYILAHDLGTSGNKATLYNFAGELKASEIVIYETAYPKQGWAEQNPEDWWYAVCASTKKLLEKSSIEARQIAGVCFSGQMMGCLLLDQEGKPLRPMIIWADMRAGKEEKEMIRRVGADRGYHITGHRLSASYSVAKLLWVKENEQDVYRKTAKMIHAKDYIIYQLTGNLVTDYSDASSTNLLDISRKKWSEELIEQFEIRRDILPELHASTDCAGKVSREAAKLCGLLEGTPVIIGGGDGSCACVGAGVVDEGKTYSILGSSSWISTVSKEPYFEDKMRTFNWVHLDQTLYTPCGTMQAAGLSYKWYRDTLAQEEKKRAVEENLDIYQLLNEQASRAAPGANGVLFLPYLLGERSPRWNSNAKGCYIGMTISTTKNDMVRSVLEGIGYNLKTIMNLMENNLSIKDIIVIGGGARSDVWLQILSDIWQKELLIPRYREEATSMGAAICAGVGIGVFENFHIMKSFNSADKIIKPNTGNYKVYQKMYAGFEAAYEGLQSTFQML